MTDLNCRCIGALAALIMGCGWNVGMAAGDVDRGARLCSVHGLPFG